MTERAGIVGVGRMGHGLAINMARKGWPLTFVDHPGNQPVEDLRAAGAASVPTPAALAAEADIIVLCVTGATEVEAVLTGPDGLLSTLRRGTLVIDCSTSLPETSRAMAERVQAAGGRFLDAPMTRTPKEAAEGRINLIVGGEAALVEECRPLLESFAENITHAGPVGAGHALKLLHNFVSLGMVAIVNEAAVAARNAGVAPEVLHLALDQGGGKGVALDRLAPFLLEGDPGGLAFSIDNAAKDTGYYMQMVRAMGLEAALAPALAEHYAGAALRGHGARLVSEVSALDED